MFEYDEEIVEVLLKESVDFKRLYDKHLIIKRDVDSRNAGNIPVNDMELEGNEKRKIIFEGSNGPNYRRIQTRARRLIFSM